MEKEAQSCLGRCESELVLILGEPTRTELDGHGGVVLIYECVGRTPDDSSQGWFGQLHAGAPERGDRQLLRKLWVTQLAAVEVAADQLSRPPCRIGLLLVLMPLAVVV